MWGGTGEQGNDQQIWGLQPSPLIRCMGNRGNTNMFLNINAFSMPSSRPLLFPKKNEGVQLPRLKPLETLTVPTIPPFPNFLFSEIFEGERYRCESSD